MLNIEKKSDTVWQIWDQKRKINNIDVDSLDQHGKVYDDGR